MNNVSAYITTLFPVITLFITYCGEVFLCEGRKWTLSILQFLTVLKWSYIHLQTGFFLVAKGRFTKPTLFHLFALSSVTYIMLGVLLLLFLTNWFLLPHHWAMPFLFFPIFKRNYFYWRPFVATLWIFSLMKIPGGILSIAVSGADCRIRVPKGVLFCI